MPNFNGTGPNGQGAMTGRGMGPCGNGMARGRGFRGFGRGLGRFYGERVITEKEEKQMVQDEIGYLEEELKALKDRLKEFK